MCLTCGCMDAHLEVGDKDIRYEDIAAAAEQNGMSIAEVFDIVEHRRSRRTVPTTRRNTRRRSGWAYPWVTSSVGTERRPGRSSSRRRTRGTSWWPATLTSEPSTWRALTSSTTSRTGSDRGGCSDEPERMDFDEYLVPGGAWAHLHPPLAVGAFPVLHGDGRLPPVHGAAAVGADRSW